MCQKTASDMDFGLSGPCWDLWDPWPFWTLWTFWDPWPLNILFSGPLWSLLGPLALLDPLGHLGPLALLDPLGLLGPLALILFLIIRFSGRPVSRSGRRAAMGGLRPPQTPPDL